MGADGKKLLVTRKKYLMVSDRGYLSLVARTKSFSFYLRPVVHDMTTSLRLLLGEKEKRRSGRASRCYQNKNESKDLLFS